MGRSADARTVCRLPALVIPRRDWWFAARQMATIPIRTADAGSSAHAVSVGRWWLRVIILLWLVGCKPAAFAPNSSALLVTPPATLTDVNAFWNDPASGMFGEISMAAGAYRRDGASCRPARQTTLSRGGGVVSDTNFLYCRSGDDTWRLQDAVVCRATQSGADLVCRGADGNDFAMPPDR